MYQALPNSSIQSARFSLGNNLISSDFVSGHPLRQGPQRVIGSQSYHPHSESRSCSPSASRGTEQSRMRSWMKPYEYRPRIPGGHSGKTPIGQNLPSKEGVGYWFQPSRPFEAQPARTQSQPVQQQFTLHSYWPSTESTRATSGLDATIQHMVSDEKRLESVSEALVSKGIKARDPSSVTFQTVQRPDMYFPIGSWPSFSDTDESRGAMSGSDCTGSQKGEKALTDLGSSDVFQGLSLMSDDGGSVSQYHATGSSDTGSTTAEGSCLGEPILVPWSVCKVPNQLSIQLQETWPDQLAWGHMPYFPNSVQDPEFGSSMPINDDIHGPQVLDNNLQGTNTAFLSSACEAEFNLGLGREQATMSSGEIFGISNPSLGDRRNEYRFDRPLYDTENLPAARIDGSDAFQGERDLGPVAYPSETRNAFLIECKRRGLSYKDIKKIGGFKEAESTLRGRFRTLTKSKEQRVRKPQWQPRDIQLLCEAVNTCSEPHGGACSPCDSFCCLKNNTQPPKVSWKKVAQYIWSHGGSYYFGNATCKKKWCEVHGIKRSMIS